MAVMMMMMMMIVIPGSASVSDGALQRACYVLRFLLADRADLRQAFYKAHGRIAVIGDTERITTLPDYSVLPQEFEQATRGVGALPAIPVSSAGEENIRCQENDLYLSEDILIREIAVGLLRVAVKRVSPDSYAELATMYHYAKVSGWWRNTYASRTVDAYFVSLFAAMYL